MAGNGTNREVLWPIFRVYAPDQPEVVGWGLPETMAIGFWQCDQKPGSAALARVLGHCGSRTVSSSRQLYPFDHCALRAPPWAQSVLGAYFIFFKGRKGGREEKLVVLPLPRPRPDTPWC